MAPPPLRVRRQLADRCAALTALVVGLVGTTLCCRYWIGEASTPSCWAAPALRGTSLRLTARQRYFGASGVARQAQFSEDAGENFEAAAKLLAGGSQAQEVDLPPEVEEVAAKGLDVLPRLPEWADQVVGIFLTIFPIIVIGSWVTMNVTYYNESKKNREDYEKKKMQKAMEYNEEDGINPLEQKRPRRKKRTALDEAIALDREEERKQSATGRAY